MQRLEVSGAVRLLWWSFCPKVRKHIWNDKKNFISLNGLNNLGLETHCVLCEVGTEF